jgi:hypothetical protein
MADDDSILVIPAASVKLAGASLPLTVQMTFNTPTTVNYKLWFQLPGGSWTELTSGSLPDSISQAGGHYTIPAAADGTLFDSIFTFTGTVDTPIDGSVVFQQGGAVLTGGTVNLVGKIASGHVTSGRVKATFNV